MMSASSSKGKAVQPIIFAEFNELCPWLIDQWMTEGLLPNFKRLHDRSTVFETRADVEDSGQLEPWIQWYSLHTGLAYSQHGVFHLTEGAAASHEDLWHAIRAAGRKVGSFASMNSRPFDFDDGFYVADPWSENANAAPAELNIYNRFIAQNVREYSNPGSRMGMGDYTSFLSFMLRHGLRVSTIAKIVKQLARERTRDRRLSWQRVALMDRMQFDVFRHYQRKHRPDFSTFFINSTAHLQHSYWRSFQPERFTVQPSADDLKLYGDAIRFGYRAMDDLLGDLIALADESGAQVVFMTALSQQPFLKAEASGGKHFYRMHDVEGFFKRFALPFADIDPTMTHQYLARFAIADDKPQVQAALATFTLSSGGPVFDFSAHESDGLYFNCNLSSPASANLTFFDAHGNALPFAGYFYPIDATKSGCHHPSGALWFATGTHKKVSDPVSILDIFPTTLDLLGISGADSGDRTGVSLVRHLVG
jgi:Type I phosphodiesterase / nucleotide pyrophosphatase